MGLWRSQPARDTHQVMRVHANHACAWTVQISDGKERDGNDQRQNEKQLGLLFAMRHVAEQDIAANSDQSHQGPCRNLNAFSPGCLCVSLRSNTSFRLETVKATMGVVLAVATVWTTDQRSRWSRA